MTRKLIVAVCVVAGVASMIGGASAAGVIAGGKGHASNPTAVASAARGPRGKRGPKGMTGPQGPQGSPGIAGAAGATKVVVRSGELKEPTSVASCAAGEVAVGGGGYTHERSALLFSSIPVPQSGTPTGWEVAAETVTEEPALSKAYVICASP